MSNVKKEALSGVKWGLLSTVPMLPLSFAFTMIISRLIPPAEMGILALTAVFFSIANQLQNAGFGAALIRKVNRTEKDINTVFWYNIFMTAIMATLLCLLAPWFAKFYKQPGLVDVTRFSAVLMFLSSTTSVHFTLFQARRDFKTPAIIGMVAGTITMPFAIWAAYNDWSYWAILYQGAATAILTLVAVWIFSPWKPKLLFSWTSFKEFFGFGSRLVVSAFVTNIYIDLRTFIIGKFYTSSNLACYVRSNRLSQIPQNFVIGTLVGTTYPILAAIQNDENYLIATFRKYCRFVSMITSWSFITISFSSYPLVELCYGKEWLDAAIYLQIICIAVIGNPLSEMISQMYKVKGKPGLLVKRDLINRPIAIVLMLIGASHSIVGICYAAVLVDLGYVILSMYLLKSAINISMRTQISDFLHYIILALLANIPAYFINLTDWAPIYKFVLSVGSSLLIYTTFLQLRKDPTWRMVLDLLREKGVFKRIPFLKKL